MLVCLINSSEIEAEDIVLKYFEAGHTFMSADSVHHGVEQQMRKVEGGNVYDFSDFKQIIQKSNGGAMEVVEMMNNDFKSLKGQQAQVKLKSKDRPMLSDIMEVKFKRGSNSLFVKTNHSEPLGTEFDFLKKSFRVTLTNELLRPEPRGISSVKKDDIIKKLCPLMPESRRTFWRGITTNDESPDLVDNFE